MEKDLVHRVMSHLAQLRMKKQGPERVKEVAGKAGKAAWAKLSPEQRSAEIKRRWQVRRKKKTPD